MNLLSIGLGNFVPYDRIVAIVAPDSAPVKRLVQDAKDKGTAVDATYGRRTRAVIVMDSGQVILCSIQPETIVDRNVKKGSKVKAAVEE
jgi:regulator of extracellular matrix RemA (YlzA/DUF370 family)